MNVLEQQLGYPLGDTLPAPGEAIAVAPGVRWLRMALPFALDHINLWLLRDAIDGANGPVPGWTLVDCGIDNPPTRAAWEQIFAHHLDGLPVLRLIVTHLHPDHIGLAHWLTERWGVRMCSRMRVSSVSRSAGVPSSPSTTQAPDCECHTRLCPTTCMWRSTPNWPTITAT